MVAKTERAAGGKPTAEEANEKLLSGGALVEQEKPIGDTSIVAANAYDDLEEADPNQREFGADDVAVPVIKVLQDLSPQTKKTKAEFIEGAKPGMFLNTATEQLFDGEQIGILVIPCAFLNSYTEWKPRGRGGEASGGLVADRTDEEGVHEVWQALFAKRGEHEGKIVLPNGNELNRSMDHYVLVTSAATPEGPWSEAVFRLGGSQSKKSRRWNALIQSRTLVRSNGKVFRPLSCAFAYSVKTKEESNNDGAWAGVDIKPFGPNPSDPSIMGMKNGKELYGRALAFRNLVLEGKRRAAIENPAEDAANGFRNDPSRPADGPDDAENYGDDGRAF